ncbi:uncharacterized protein V1516DRAFT_669716 [Lipomyces oligophaga]|uniref:uncharacterized protein n=1 Tax=Lipomyces oligophaga TaxID=45792 RepID=UPI0034D00F8F
MAPTILPTSGNSISLVKRYWGYSCSYYGTCSTWYYWGRWVLLGVVVAVALITLLLCICACNRRRSKKGLPPAYGTAWVPFSGGQVYPNRPQNYGPPPGPPPAYNPATHPSPVPVDPASQAYYSNGAGNNGQQTGTFNGGNNYEMRDYPPPVGPPPAVHVK